MAGAKVAARHRDTGLERVSEPTDAGLFTIQRLPVGVYTLTVEKTGFKAAKRENRTISVGGGHRGGSRRRHRRKRPGSPPARKPPLS